MINRLIILLIGIAFIGCESEDVISNAALYDIEINYEPIDYGLYEKKIDSIYLIFETRFIEDTVDVYVNGDNFCHEIINTNESAGQAFFLNIGNYKEVKNFSFRINNGKLVYIEPLKHLRFIGIDYLEREGKKKVYASYYSMMPSYD